MVQKDKTYLITGASGFLGSLLTQYIIENGGKVHALSRNEGNLIGLQLLMKEKYNTWIEIFPGDVSDDCIVRKAAINCHGIFHLAGFKHVTMAEDHSLQCISTNVKGSLNVCEASKDFKTIKFVIATSTDKAAQIIGVYGATKRLMEKIFEEYQQSDQETKYRIVRYGNVLYSTGSVLTIWKKLLQSGKDIQVTNPNSTRFYWTREQALELLFDCLRNAEDPSPYIPEMKSIELLDLAHCMWEKYGSDQSEILINKLESSENLHEKIDENGPYSDQVEQYSQEEIMKMI